MVLGSYDKNRFRDMEHRIYELEEILCPAQSHDWKNIETFTLMRIVDNGNSPNDIYHVPTQMVKQICNRCKKYREVIYKKET